MTARRAWEMNEDASVTVVTPEDEPLALFGREVSAAVSRLLEGNRVLTITSTDCSTPHAGEVLLHPGGHSLYADRVIALPALFGPATPGVPKREGHGFIPTDVYGRVPGLEAVFAAGDATDFPVKHGGVAAQQADVAAASIAALAGAPVEPSKFHPVIHGMLLGGGHPLYLSAEISGRHGVRSEVSAEPTWSPPSKIAAKYLAPYLEARAPAAVR
jgi:sulfide:quinone oxidoreductase